MCEGSKPWDAVYDQLTVFRLPDCVPFSPATDAELDEVEDRLRSRLPPSYRAFMKRFGPGAVGWSPRLAPLWPQGRYDSGLVEDTIRLRLLSDDRLPNAERRGRAVYFGCDTAGDPFAWDPTEMSEATGWECPVYWLEWGRAGEPRKQADTFIEFIRVRSEERRLLFGEDSPLWDGPANNFEPCYIRMKLKPDWEDCARWLVFNNNVVRDLALAIRDEKRVEAFPVLADALEEAGCTNADLLDSCRHGDPDIDGLWVLRILLGTSL